MLSLAPSYSRIVTPLPIALRAIVCLFHLPPAPCPAKAGLSLLAYARVGGPTSVKIQRYWARVSRLLVNMGASAPPVPGALDRDSACRVLLHDEPTTQMSGSVTRNPVFAAPYSSTCETRFGFRAYLLTSQNSSLHQFLFFFSILPFLFPH